MFLRYVKIHHPFRAFSASRVSLSFECIVESTKPQNSPIVFLQFIEHDSNRFFFSFYLRVNFNRFHLLLCFLSIYLIFFSPFRIVKFQHRRLLLAFHRQRVLSIVDVISLPLDSIQVTAVMMIRWRPRCANTSKDRTFFFPPTKTKNSDRGGCAVLAAVRRNKSRSIFALAKILFILSLEFCTPSNSLSFCCAHIFDQ